jgi:hypothetical protein
MNTLHIRKALTNKYTRPPSLAGDFSVRRKRRMDLIELYVSYGNRATEEWDSVAKLEIDYLVEPDWSIGVEALKDQERNRFKKVSLPNGEVIEIAALYRAESHDFTLTVKQEETPLMQVLCEGMPVVGFRTLAGVDISIQVHPRGYFSTDERHA